MKALSLLVGMWVRSWVGGWVSAERLVWLLVGWLPARFCPSLFVSAPSHPCLPPSFPLFRTNPMLAPPPVSTCINPSSPVPSFPLPSVPTCSHLTCPFPFTCRYLPRLTPPLPTPLLPRDTLWPPYMPVPASPTLPFPALIYHLVFGIHPCPPGCCASPSCLSGALA